MTGLLRLRRRTKLLTPIVTAAAMVALAACGSDSATDGGDTGPGTSADSADLEAFEVKVDEVVAERSAEITEPPPAESPPVAEGKKVFVIACILAAEGCARESRGSVEAGEAMGWDMTLIDTGSLPDKMNAAVQQAIDAQADGIILQAIDVAALKAPLEQADAAGIKIVCFACINQDDIADQTIPSEQSFFDDGYALGAAMYQNTDGSPKLIQMVDETFGVVPVRYEGLNQFFEDCQAAGGDCEVVETTNFLVTELTTRVAQLTSQLVRQHPEANAISMPYDSAEPFVSDGLRQAGKSPGQIGVYGFDGNSAQIGQIREGGFEVATMAGPFEWAGYAEIDALNRLFNGEEPVEDVVKIRLITKDSLPPEDQWSGDVDYKSAYLKAWGLS